MKQPTGEYSACYLRNFRKTNQTTPFMDQFLFKYQCGFRKGLSAQHCLLSMLEKCKKPVDTKKNFGALLTDLSKAFDSLPHDLIIAKHIAYGFSLPALNLIQNYLGNRKQRTKINDFYSLMLEVVGSSQKRSNL